MGVWAANYSGGGAGPLRSLGAGMLDPFVVESSRLDSTDGIGRREHPYAMTSPPGVISLAE